MELLGRILHFSKSGRLIVKIDQYKSALKVGKNIIDDQGKRIGKISEFLGPIQSPYASIIPYVQKRGRLTGANVYLESFRKNSKPKLNNLKIKKNKK